MRIDGADKKIISLLQQNSRITNTEIAKQIGLTEGAIRHRIDQLVKQKHITRFTIDVSAADAFCAVIMLKAKNDVKKMMRETTDLHFIVHAYEISGNFDGCIVVEGEDISAIDRLIDQLRGLKTVATTKTFVVLKKWQ